MRMDQGTVFSRTPVDAAAVAHSLEGVRDACFWLEDVPGRVGYPALAGSTTTDLLVVGGGYCGLWTAVIAKQRDPRRRVVLIEAEEVGWAASGRNGGFCAASITHGEENGRTRWPDEYDELERLGIANLDALEATVNEFSMDCDFERTGEIDVAIEEYQAEQLRASGADVIDDWGIDQLDVGQRITYDVKANWKLIVENFMECYHCATIHPELTEVLPEFADGYAAQYFVGHGAEFGENVQGFTVDGSEGVAAIPGVVPSLMRMPAGCAFSPRCKFAIDACRAAVPPLAAVNPQHRSRCIRWREI